jgi:enoyl-CoA hydratase
MSYENVTVSKEEGLGTVTINRPKALNALNSATLKELAAAFDEMAQAADIKVVILTGGGDRAFVAGADISEMVNYTPTEAEAFAALGQGVMFRIEKLPKPVIAAMHGFALGGGCEIAMACDIRIATDKLKIGQPEVKLGVLPGFGGTQRLSRIVGPGKAKEIIFSGDVYDSVEALRIGLVDRVVPFEKLMEETKKLARTIASRGEVAVRLAKDAINAGMDVDIGSGCMLERKAFGMCFASQDRVEGMKAFLEKREPKFTGK